MHPLLASLAAGLDERSAAGRARRLKQSQRSDLRTTSLSPDHTASTAHTLMST